MNIGATSSSSEQQAEAFASYLLAPSDTLYAQIEKVMGSRIKFTMPDVIKLEQYFQMSHLAMLTRLARDRYISQEEIEEMRDGVTREAGRLGYGTSLYSNNPEYKTTLGHYLAQAKKLVDGGIISDGKYEELLVDAFRDDIVFGTEAGGDNVD